MYIERNLELQAARYRLERTRADQIAARLRPNPTLSITPRTFGSPGRQKPLACTKSAPPIPKPSSSAARRAVRERVADATVSAAEARFADAMRQGLAEVKALYFEAVLAAAALKSRRKIGKRFSSSFS